MGPNHWIPPYAWPHALVVTISDDFVKMVSFVCVVTVISSMCIFVLCCVHVGWACITMKSGMKRELI